MKKVFPLKAPGKVDARVVEGVKHDVRKYVKRERAKALPVGFDLWTFACKVGATAESAAECPLGEVSPQIDRVADAGASEVYIEVTAVPAQRSPSSEDPAVQ